jgi:hypothetical protein
MLVVTIPTAVWFPDLFSTFNKATVLISPTSSFPALSGMLFEWITGVVAFYPVEGQIGPC